MTTDARTLEIENQRLQAKLEAAEKAAQQANMERSRVQNDAVVARQQNEELVASLRRSEFAAKEKAARLEEQLQAAQQERRRATDTAEAYSNEATKRVHALEAERERLQSRIVALEKSLETKNTEIERTVLDADASKDQLERVVAKLNERCRRLEDDAKHQHAKAERDVDEMMREQQRAAAELMDTRRRLQGAQDEVRLLEGQVANSKAVNQDLVDELDATKRRMRALEEDADDARANADRLARRVEELRGDVDELTAKLAKADGHIQRLTQQAEEAHMEAIKLKHELELLDGDVAAARRDHDDVVSRLTPFLSAVAEDTDRVTALLDRLLLGVSVLASMNSGNVDSSHRSGSAAGGEGRAFSCWPSPTEAEAGNRGGTTAAASTLIVASMRLRDALALVVDDLEMVRRGVDEETARKRDALRKDRVVEETLQAERAHVLELAAKLGDAEQKAEETESQRQALEKALGDSSQWMAEAVALQEERTRRVEGLIEDKEALQATVAALEAKIADLQTALRNERDATEREHDAARKAVGDAKAAQRTIQSLEEEVAAAKRATSAARTETAEREADVQRLKALVNERDEANHRLDTDVRYLRRQAEELQGKLRVKEEAAAALEAREQQLRDQLHSAQRRLDAALRSGGTTGSLSAGVGSPAHNSSSSAAAAAALPARGSTPVTGAHTRLTTGTTLRDSPASRRDGTPTRTAGTPHARYEPRDVSPPRHTDPAGTGASMRSSAAARVEYRSPPRSAPSATTPRAGAGAQAAKDEAATERLKAWEARINSLLSSSRKS